MLDHSNEDISHCSSTDKRNHTAGLATCQPDTPGSMNSASMSMLDLFSTCCTIQTSHIVICVHTCLNGSNINILHTKGCSLTTTSQEYSS